MIQSASGSLTLIIHGRKTMSLIDKKIAGAALAAVFTLTMFSATPVPAADGGGFTITPSCKKGKVWDKRKKKCVRVKKSSMFDDESIYQTGRDLAMRGRFDDAIVVLSNSRNKNDPRVLNYLGYSHRNVGRIDVGLGYYQKALRIDPDYTLVREYMGEAFLQKGEVDRARNQLVEIENRCGKKCREYAMLAQRIDRYLAK
jgi:tetratricopeptide (TPR) repeat protein